MVTAMYTTKILRKIAEGFSAGVMIVIGCAVFLAMKTDHPVVGAVLFSVALLTICIKGYALYTGKIGLMPDSHKKDDFETLFFGLLGNTLACALLGWLVGLGMDNLHGVASAVVASKLEQTFFETLLKGTLCGVLMYVAVSVYRENKTPIGILFAIPVFILSGFEHSIADMGYFAIGGEFSLVGFGYIWTVILGNTLGGLLLPALKRVGGSNNDLQKKEKFQN